MRLWRGDCAVEARATGGRCLSPRQGRDVTSNTPTHVLRSISSNWTLNALQIAVFMVLTPFTFRALGTEAFGIWEVIVSTAAPIQLLALGLPMATVRAVSGSLHGDDPDAAGRAAGTAFSMTLILGLVAAAVGAVVAFGRAARWTRWWFAATREKSSNSL